MVHSNAISASGQLAVAPGNAREIVLPACRRKTRRRHAKPQGHTREQLDLIRDTIRKAKTEWPMRVRRVYYILRTGDRMPLQRTGAPYMNPSEMIEDRVNMLRVLGEIPWEAITDTHRTMEIDLQWYDPAGFVEDHVEYFLTDYNRELFQDCEYVPEIWLEKDSAVEMIRPLTNKYHIRRVICRGHTSNTYAHLLAERALDRYAERRQKTLLLYCCDMDIAGALMPQTLWRTLVEDHGIDGEILPVRALLGPQQVKELGLPTEPADKMKGESKLKHDYTEWLGVRSAKQIYGCELDALSRQQVERILLDALWDYVDQREVNLQLEQEAADRKRISQMRAGVIEDLRKLVDK